ncbi:hypothetical protein AtDm6_1016 [Acetobacter tropicalis]|uniref:Uncharacterized protein n=1 Tax=Acetobacter tropicalis TaxID=104102 RepID=A0A094YTQ6_9PROT|nr:hypothetical protein AtDm6_1016 [Acetobacter tropicalis]
MFCSNRLTRSVPHLHAWDCRSARLIRPSAGASLRSAPWHAPVRARSVGARDGSGESWSVRHAASECGRVTWSSSCSFRFSKTGRTAHAGVDRVRDRRRRPACRRVGEPILFGVPEGCVGQNWGDHVSLTRFALAHGTMGRLRESLVFLLCLTSGDQRCRPRPGKARGKRSPEGPARGDRAGLVVGTLLPVPAARPGPDEGVAFPFLVGEQVGEDWGGEGGIVQLQAQIGAAFVGAAGPCGAEFNPSEVDAVVGGVVVGPVGFRHQADVAGLQGQGDDFAFEAFTHLLEGTDVSHCRISMLLSGRDHRGLDGDRPAGGERHSTLQGRSAAEDGRAGTFLSREE